MTKKLRINNRRDILLIMLCSPGRSESVNEPISGKTRLVKMLFLFKEELLSHFRRNTEITEDNFYKFFPWDFGPFSGGVYDDLTFFQLRGFVESSAAEEEALPESAAEWAKWLADSGAADSDDAVDYSEETFRLTEDGLVFAGRLYDQLSMQQRLLLKEFKARLVSTPLRAILKYVYERYPRSAEKSSIREGILGLDS
jgi:hypothetical protein